LLFLIGTRERKDQLVVDVAEEERLRERGGLALRPFALLDRGGGFDRPSLPAAAPR
jgi:hypothetical protein